MQGVQRADRYLVFRVGDDKTLGLFALDITEVLQAFEFSGLTPVPMAPPIVLGLTNYHGRIVTVIDPKPFLQSPGTGEPLPRESEELRHSGEFSGQIVLLREGSENKGNVGLYVPRIEEIVPLDALQEVDIPVGKCISWVAQYEEKLIQILRTDEIRHSLNREFDMNDTELGWGATA